MTSETNRSSIDLKVILIGAAGVGKTAFINRYIHKDYREHSSTIGASFLLKTWNSHKIALWDTSGEEKYRGLSRYYCRGAGAVIMAFDLSDPNSFLQLEQEFVPLLEHTIEGRVVAVVGMRSDLVASGRRGGGGKGGGGGGDDDKNVVGGSKSDAAANAKDATRNSQATVDQSDFPFKNQALQLLSLLNKPSAFKPLYFETSALLGSSVDDVFEALFTSAFHNLPRPPSPSPSISLSSRHQPEKTHCSC